MINKIIRNKIFLVAIAIVSAFLFSIPRITAQTTQYLTLTTVIESNLMQQQSAHLFAIRCSNISTVDLTNSRLSVDYTFFDTNGQAIANPTATVSMQNHAVLKGEDSSIVPATASRTDNTMFINTTNTPLIAGRNFLYAFELRLNNATADIASVTLIMNCLAEAPAPQTTDGGTDPTGGTPDGGGNQGGGNNGGGGTIPVDSGETPVGGNIDFTKKKPVYRFFNQIKKTHFYTIDETEKDLIVETNPFWVLEGQAFDVFEYNNQIGKCVYGDPVYRFYNSTQLVHFYTIDQTEKINLETFNPNWKYEGIAYCAFKAQRTESQVKPLYRFWSSNRAAHLFTSSEQERVHVEQNIPDFGLEGIVYYVVTE